MKTILIAGFRSLDNYGSGMMGLVTIDRLSALIEGPVTFLSDFNANVNLDEIRGELGLEDHRVTLGTYTREKAPSKMVQLRRFLGDRSAADARLLIVLGGDDISEYYRPNIWRHILQFWRRARSTPVVLLAQTIGPFDRISNRLAAAILLRAMWIFPRDRWTTRYLKEEFSLGARLEQGSDLAYVPLPLQHRKDIEAEILARYGLERDTYATIVVSALQKDGYYTTDKAQYLTRFKEIIERLLNMPEMQGKRICLLAHTFSNYGDEAAYIAELLPLIDPKLRDRVVPVMERVLQTRARFILGAGLFTITGRMHAAVSTFQMGKPAITLSYSKKYEGVIGTMIGRSDLILDGNHPAIWADGTIVEKVLERVGFVLGSHQMLCAEIRTAIEGQRVLVDNSLARSAALVGT